MLATLRADKGGETHGEKAGRNSMQRGAAGVDRDLGSRMRAIGQ